MISNEDTIISWRNANSKRSVSWTNHGESGTVIRVEDEFGRYIQAHVVYSHTDYTWSHRRTTQDIAAKFVRELDGLFPPQKEGAA